MPNRAINLVCDRSQFDGLIEIGGGLARPGHRLRLAVELRRTWVRYTTRLAIEQFPSAAVRVHAMTRIAEHAEKILREMQSDGEPGVDPKAVNPQLLAALQYQAGDAQAVIEALKVVAVLAAWASDAAFEIENPEFGSFGGFEIKAKTWLIGVALPQIFERYFGPFSISKPWNKPGQPSGRGIDFVKRSAALMEINVSASNIDKTWNRYGKAIRHRP